MFSGYLKRRVEWLVQKHESGELFYSKSIAEKPEGLQLLKEISSIKKLPNGEIDITSVSREVRFFAKSVYRMSQLFDEEKLPKENQLPDISLPEIINLQREYFELLEQFFMEAFGKAPNKFVKSEDELFGEAVQRYKNDKILKQVFDAHQKYVPLISKFYSDHVNNFLQANKYIGGLKYVLGGSSRFPRIAFDGIRKYLLYADTIFVPDPVLPWFEVDRIEDRHFRVRMIEACFDLLKLKPLVDADLPYPAIIVFPSWEKSLSTKDDYTKDMISEFLLNFFSHYLGINFEDENEIRHYVSTDGSKHFRDIVINKRLFLPPDSPFPSEFSEAVKKYKNFLNDERSDEFLKLIDDWSAEELILNGISERLEPQVHVRDNASMLGADPLFWLEPHYYYFQLCSQLMTNELEQYGAINPQSTKILQSLNSAHLSWLGNISTKDLIKLRQDNCNEDFRKQIKEYFDTIENTRFDEINKVVPEVGRAISSLLTDHDKKAKLIIDKYERKYAITLGASVLTLGVDFCAFLAPHIGTFTTLGPIGKLVVDGYNHYRDYKLLKNSLFGVLSSAARGR